MTNAVVLSSPAAVAVPEHQRRNPLLALPPEWAKPVGYFLSARALLIREPLGLCLTLKVWIERCGLTLADALPILNRLASPELAREHQFESELMADLAAMVAERLRSKRIIADMLERRQGPAARKEPDGAVAAMLAGIVHDANGGNPC